MEDRVEAVTPVEDRGLRDRLWDILQIMLNDQRQAWEMQPNGEYRRRHPADAEQAAGTHAVLMERAQKNR